MSGSTDVATRRGVKWSLAREWDGLDLHEIGEKIVAALEAVELLVGEEAERDA